VWCARLLTVDGRLYALTFAAAPAHVRAAVDALRGATRCRPLALPALPAEAFGC
jgi:hypothetical protein